MATLQFKGKNIIWNHHMSVPYHTLDLDEKLSYKQDKADGNLIIEGDNLPALKSLLPQYTGKIDCIYIDPPYNTGNEGWVYNDNVNSPLVKEWIGKEVGSDDLTRHDKWLSMMTPRLRLMRELLSNTGVMFISIDDNEVYRLKQLLDEIFGEENFLANFIWNHRKSKQNDISVSLSHNYTLVYGRNSQAFEFIPLPTDSSKFANPDNDSRGPWVADPFDAPGVRENLQYPIVNPNTKEEYLPPNGRHWRFTKKKYEKALEENRIIFGKSGNSKPQYKRFLSEANLKGLSISTIWDEVETATQGTKEVMKLFDGEKTFDTPKPTSLIQKVLKISTSKKALILDAFAGSGTTAQAVLELNEEDEGNRKFILIQMPENSEKEPMKNIARDITRERVVKVIEKKLKNKDIGFEYRRVGQPIDAETILSGQLPTYKQLAKYVYYLATGQSPKEKDIDEKKYLAGKVDHTEVYLLYTPDMEELRKLAITFEWAKEISKGNENKKIVYAPACFMDDEYLEQFNMKFVSIPYNLFEREK